MEVRPAAGSEHQDDFDRFTNVARDKVKISAALLSRLPADGNAIISPPSIVVLAAMSCAEGRCFTADLQRALGLCGYGMDDFVSFLSCPSRPTTAYVAENVAIGADCRRCIEELAGSVSRLDFSQGPEAVRQQINEQVGEKTSGHIKTALPPGTIASDASLVLLNATYFNGLWKEPFDPKRTRAADFHVGAGKAITVQMMSLTSYFRCGVDKTRRLQLLQLPYSDEDEMLLLLPFKGVSVDDTLRLLNGSVLNELYTITDRSHLVPVDVALPRFSVSSFVDVKSGLNALGIRGLFGNSSHLSKLASSAQSRGEFACVHRAVIDVSEAGAKAAAQVSEAARCMVWPEEFICNRPFVFAVRSRKVFPPILLGRVCNPNLYAEK